MTENQLLERIRSRARRDGWLVFHPHDSRRSEKGFPDLTLARGPRLIFAELKSEKGRMRDGQSEWLRAVAATGAEAYLWRPALWESGAIQALLA